MTRKRGRHAHNVFPLAIAAYEICRQARLRQQPLRIQYTHKCCNCYALALWQCKT